MLEFEKFKLKMLNEFKKEYDMTEIQGDLIKIQSGSIEATLPVQDAYNEYKLVKNFDFICKQYLKILDKEFKKTKFQVDYNNVFPLIKRKDFGRDERLNFKKEHLFLDLDIFYVCDMEKSFRFLLEEDQFDFDKLRKSSFKNINKIDAPLVKLDKNLEIYTLYFPSDYGASLILSEKFRKQITNKIGKNYLFVLPSTSSILVAKNSEAYVDILKYLIKTDNDPHKISQNIYRYKDGYSEYADRNNILKVIK